MPLQPLASPQPQRRSRAPIVIAAVVVAVVVLTLIVTGLVATVVIVQKVSDNRQRQLAAVNLDDLIVYDDLRSDHTEDDVDYDMVPPAGGPHAPAWLACGTYDEPVRDENAVHDLEHGSVWITYDPELDDDDVSALAEALPDNAIMSPYDGLPSPVVLTVWEHQLQLSGADDPRLPLFLDAYADGRTAPEAAASCAGGLTEGDGGTSSNV